MTDPKPQAKSTVPSKGGPIAVAVLVAALAAMLLPSEGRKYTPYRDSAGIWTVCMGIIGKDVVPGKHYSPAECDALESRFLTNMVREMAQCTPQDILGTMTKKQWLWLGHWNYNTGAFCNSGVHRKLVAGDRAGSCREMGKWTFITVNGRKVNCRTAGRLCPGIVTRRDMEVAGCLDALS